MTQLVELQKHRAALAEAGIEVYAITYDPQDALAKFAQQHGITYQLLSDQGSEVIRRFGILNTQIAPDDPMRHPVTGQSFYGIPYPGTYITDENGVVVEKSFFQQYEKRVSAGTILDRALGRVMVHDEAPHEEARDRMATVSAFLSDDTLRLDVAATLYVRIAMDEGFHVYGEPLPEGFIPTTVEVGPVAGLEIGAPEYPATHGREFPELGVTLPVYDATADVAVEVTAKAPLFGGRGTEAKDGAAKMVRIPVEVTYQACSETVCHRPRTVELSVEAPLASLVVPDFRR
jgi:peroxiredoxin